MATWTTQTRTITRREWIVPMYSGSNDHAQLLQAIHAARQACANARVHHPHGNPDDLSDDAVMVSVGDAEIVLWFETDRIKDI